jgi:hypothetical protein
MTTVHHDSDFYAWAKHNATLLRQGLTEQADLEHIAEELEDMGKSERRALESFVRNILMHLLKWQFQPRLRSTSWRQSIRNRRREVVKIFRDSPSLKPTLTSVIDEEYAAAREDASDETGLPLNHFPETCPFKIEQVLAEDFWPD